MRQLSLIGTITATVAISAVGSMAMTIMAGLAFATLLTLGVVPILDSILFGVSFQSFEYEAV